MKQQQDGGIGAASLAIEQLEAVDFNGVNRDILG
jgi:hypothetical protein